MRKLSFLLPLLSLCLALFFAGLHTQQLKARSTGITDRNGSPTSSGTCNDCHNDGETPSVRLTGATTMFTNAIGEYALTVSGVQESNFGVPSAGLNVGLNGGELLADTALDSYVRLLANSVGQNEIVHSSPKPASFEDASTTFAFRWQAPATAGVYTLFGAGNSVNGNFSPLGDRAALTTLEITVVEPTSTQYLPFLQQ